ncbi:MAG: sigma-70 family RNA polymerase sigma factor [Salinivirgaceae bacterium]|nr:sigma-70 family RNA polymerase sigma factor [Salinivirgaceae bacterium]MDD4746089.1 sigma-70 family RNA polymerase sigma factor [Salinivirgaceae bacterium]MDY0281096.1 sigma-70 family RNA polymerase sigma factor [Salinivirgaceae bacterium]
MEVNPNFSKRALEDFELVKRAQTGEEKAFTLLLKRYRDSIYYMLLKMVNNATDAEDLTIEAFGKAFKSIDRYSPRFAFSTWLFRIASNNCIDFLRRKRDIGYKHEANSEDISQTTGDNSSFRYVQIEATDLSPEELMISKQKGKILRDIVKELKPRYRKLIELRYFEELSYDEIAKTLDIPLGTVKAQLFRARELLFNILRDKKQNI